MSIVTPSNLDELRKKLLEEAFRKASEIIEEAKREAEFIIKRAENEWRERAENEKKKILEQAERDANRVLSEARVRARLILSEAKNKLFNEIFNNVVKKIESREGLETVSSLKNLLNESLIYINNPSKIIVDYRDVETIKKILNEKKLSNIEIIVSNDIIGGLVIEDADGRRIDNSYKTRLERSRKVLGSYITKYLWSN